LVSLNWLEHPYVKKWLAENPSVQKWLDNSERIQTQTSKGNYLYKFCQSVGETPEALKKLRYVSDKKKLAAFRKKHLLPPPTKEGEEGPPEDGGYVLLDLLQAFIRRGRMLDYGRPEDWRLKKLEANGTPGERRVIEVAKLSKHRREGFYYAVRSYFAAQRGGALPSDENFKISDVSRTTMRDDFDMEGDRGIQELNRIIMASNEPYRTLFSAAKYALMGRSELAELCGKWEKTILPALQKNEEIIRIDYTYRKSNPQPYYTFLPAKIFQPFRSQATNPFTTHRINGGRQITVDDIDRNWLHARRRAKIPRVVGVNNVRDLIRTKATNAGADASCAELVMGHTVDPLRYNQIFGDPAFVKGQWEKLRKWVDGETQEWKKDVESLTQKLEKTETARRDDRRLMVDQMLADFHYAPRQRKQIAKQHGGDLANVPLNELSEYAAKAEPEFQAKKPREDMEKQDGPPPIKVMRPGPEADKMIEQGWTPERMKDGRWRLVWKYKSKAPPLPKPQTPSPNTSTT
jgi:HPt (histidine-containing phosphotransfer) domain-containing protein